MIKKEFEFEDLFTGEKVKKEYYFHIDKTRLIEMEASVEGGFKTYLEEIVKAQDTKKILEVFKDIIKKSVGVKTPTGGFDQSEHVAVDFIGSPAFEQLYLDLFSDEKKASEFINGILPQDLVKQAKGAALPPEAQKK